jgi:hypothetical protein
LHRRVSFQWLGANGNISQVVPTFYCNFKPTERKLLILILDGDKSQTESLKLIEIAREGHVVLM